MLQKGYQLYVERQSSSLSILEVIKNEPLNYRLPVKFELLAVVISEENLLEKRNITRLH